MTTSPLVVPAAVLYLDEILEQGCQEEKRNILSYRELFIDDIHV